jgi:hypothetical protein
MGGTFAVEAETDMRLASKLAGTCPRVDIDLASAARVVEVDQELVGLLG